MKSLNNYTLTLLTVLSLQSLSGDILHIEPLEVPTGGPQYLIYGDIELSGTWGEADTLFVDVSLGDGTEYPVTMIPVDGDGRYVVFEYLNLAGTSNTGAMLEISSVGNLLPDNLSFVDLALEGMGSSGEVVDLPAGGATGKGGSTLNPYKNAIFINLNDKLQPKSLIVGQTFSSNFVSAEGTSSLMKSTLAVQSTGEIGSTDFITYDENGMIVAVGDNQLTLDNEGNVLSFTQTHTTADYDSSRNQELSDVFGWKTETDWQLFDWTSSPTQGALDYLLAVQREEISGDIGITAAQAQAIRQGVLQRYSLPQRAYVNGCLSAEGLDFTGIILQYEDWRWALADLTVDQMLDAARSITNVSGQYAGIQGAYLPPVQLTGSENFSQISLAYVYTGSLSGLTLDQVIASSKTKGGTVGTVFTPDQYNAWVSSIIANGVTICYVAGWNGVGNWYQVLDQLWTLNSGDVQYGNTVQNNPNQFILCDYSSL